MLYSSDSLNGPQLTRVNLVNDKVHEIGEVDAVLLLVAVDVVVAVDEVCDESRLEVDERTVEAVLAPGHELVVVRRGQSEKDILR